MLDLYLQQSFEKQSGRDQAAEVDRLLHQLPIEELKKVASFGLPEMGGASWVDKFKGTPLFESAIALEQEELQAEMQNIQSNYEMSSQHMLKQAIQLRKKLLDLELSRSGGMEMGAPAPMPGAEAPVEASAPPAPAGEKTAAPVSFGKMLSGYANKNPITTAMTVGGAAVGALKGSGQYDANGREIPRGLGSRLMGGAMGAAGGLAVGTAGSIAGRAHDLSKMQRNAGKSPLELLRHSAGTQLHQTAGQFGYGKHEGVRSAVGAIRGAPVPGKTNMGAPYMSNIPPPMPQQPTA